VDTAIENHRERIANFAAAIGISCDFALAIRFYTLDEPISLYKSMNAQLNSVSRSTDSLSNYFMYMKLLIRGLRAMGNAGYYKIVNCAYRGLRVEGNSLLQTKYDNYRSCFRSGELLTMAGFTTVTLRGYCNEQRVHRHAGL
jgi:hypothetical protein